MTADEWERIGVDFIRTLQARHLRRLVEAVANPHLRFCGGTRERETVRIRRARQGDWEVPAKMLVMGRSA